MRAALLPAKEQPIFTTSAIESFDELKLSRLCTKWVSHLLFDHEISGRSRDLYRYEPVLDKFHVSLISEPCESFE